MASSSEPRIKLGYWHIRGLAQPIRTLLRHLQVPFEDVLFMQGDAPSFSRDAWLKVKPTLALDYANLPYLEDGAVRLTQSQAILRYLARTYGPALYSGTPAELAVIDEAMDQAVDLRNSYTRVAYGGAAFDAFADAVAPGFLAAFERVLARGGGSGFICGAAPSIADFTLCEVLEGVALMVAELAPGAGREPDAYRAFPHVAAYKARFEALTARARALPEYMARPFNNKIAVWK